MGRLSKDTCDFLRVTANSDRQSNWHPPPETSVPSCSRLPRWTLLISCQCTSWCSVGTKCCLIWCLTITPPLSHSYMCQLVLGHHVLIGVFHLRPELVGLWALANLVIWLLLFSFRSSVHSSVRCWSPLPTSLYWSCPSPSPQHCSALPSSPLVSCLLPCFLGNCLLHCECSWKSTHLQICLWAQLLSNFRIE